MQEKKFWPKEIDALKRNKELDMLQTPTTYLSHSSRTLKPFKDLEMTVTSEPLLSEKNTPWAHALSLFFFNYLKTINNIIKIYFFKHGAI